MLSDMYRAVALFFARIEVDLSARVYGTEVDRWRNNYDCGWGEYSIRRSGRPRKAELRFERALRRVCELEER